MKGGSKRAWILDVADCVLQCRPCFGEALAEPLGGVRYRGGLVEVELVRDLFSEIDDAVERVRQPEDVLWIHRRSECHVGQVVEVAGDVVAFVLQFAKSRMLALALEQRAAQQTERFGYERRLFLEQFVEADGPRDQAKPQALTPATSVRQQGSGPWFRSGRACLQS